jgi:hypothetical protein
VLVNDIIGVGMRGKEYLTCQINSFAHWTVEPIIKTLTWTPLSTTWGYYGKPICVVVVKCYTIIIEIIDKITSFNYIQQPILPHFTLYFKIQWLVPMINNLFKLFYIALALGQHNSACILTHIKFAYIGFRNM